MTRFASILAAVWAASVVQAGAQTYTYVDLGVAPYSDTFGAAVNTDVEVGYGLNAGQQQALMWRNNSASAVALPSTGYQSTQAAGIYSTFAVGSGVTPGGQTVALLWNGLTQQPVNLNPSFASSSVVNGISQASGSFGQIGSATLTGTGQQVAVHWYSTASTALNMNPTGASSSQAYATLGNTYAVGSAVFSGVTHAIYWVSGTSVDLNPSGALRSEALGINQSYYGSGGPVIEEVGDYTTSAGAVHACFWLGTTASKIDLHPSSGFNSTTATGIIGFGNSYTVVGYGTRSDGTIVPLLWNGFAPTNSPTNITFIPPSDLSSYLPVGTTSSRATGIDSTYQTITGTAVINGSNHAFILGFTSTPGFLSPPQNLSTIVNVPYSYQVLARGFPAPTLSAGTLPPGLNFSSATGIISGTPTQTGTYTGTISAANSRGSSGQSFTIKVVASPPTQMSIVGSFAPANGTGLHQAMVMGSDGNFYGTSSTGGAGSGGTVYEMTPAGVQTTVHAFGDGSVASDGAQPMGLSFGSDGTLYGTTYAGGSAGKGTVFNINQGTTTILHHFSDGSVPNDGANPSNSLVQAPDGNFYGVTQSGGTGSPSEGTLFSMTSSGVVTIHTSFPNLSYPAYSGLSPNSSLIQDPLSTGVSLYGTTLSGITARGTAFQAGPAGVSTSIKNFDATLPPVLGFWPHGPLTIDSSENLYGIASAGGTSYVYNNATSDPTNPSIIGVGTVYKLSGSTQTDLHNFGDGTVGNDGSNTAAPNAPLVQGIDGNFYGVTPAGGSAGQGCLFQITPTGTMLVLHSFGDGTVANDGLVPGPVFFQGTDGYFYGVTEQGGANGNGAIYKFSIGVAPTLYESQGPPPAYVGVPYSYTYTATGFPTPTYFVSSGTLPTGLTLAPNGVLSGTPTAIGFFDWFITATNSAGMSQPWEFAANVRQTPTITNGPPANTTVGSAYSFTYTAVGYPTPKFTVTSGALPPGLNLSTAGAISGSPTTSGIYSGIVTAANGVGAATQNFNIVVSDTYTTWANAHFTSQQLGQPNYSGQNATPQNDGVPNLLKYLYGINPSQPMSATDIGALPVLGMETDSGVTYLTLTYRQNPTAGGLTVNLQTSTDLLNWPTASPPDLSETVGTDSATGDPIMKVGEKTNGASHFYIRLNATSP